ncbi:MAG: hypothetical protein KJZ79_10535 [Bryobacteraceae bacterium]|nr:hypothetical protein [Bryobacteraceae bacterium]
MWKINIIGVMRRLLVALLFSWAGGAALQPTNPRPVAEYAMSGVIFDQDGNPLAGARIEHTGARYALTMPLAGSHFEIRHSAPWIVVRKPGYVSVRVRGSNSSDLHITLKKLEPTDVLPTCAAATLTVANLYGGARFRFPIINGLKMNRQKPEAGNNVRGYWFQRGRNPAIIIHGTGHAWSWGIPLDDDVWQSVEYSERVFVEDNNSLGVLEARGKSPEGRYWRYFGKLNESVVYRDADKRTAEELDRFLDGICLEPRGSDQLGPNPDQPDQ